MQELNVLPIGLFKDGTDDGLYINSLSLHLQTSHRHIDKPHKHDFFALMLFTRGSGVHEIEFTRYEVSRGSLFFLGPGQTHNWTLSADVEGYVLFHSQEYYERHFTDIRLSGFGFFAPLNQIQSVLLEENQVVSIETHLTKIREEHRQNQNKSPLMLAAMLTELYVAIDRISPNQSLNQSNPGAYSAIFAQFNNLLDKDFRTEKSANVYADRLNITAKHLNRICRTLVGKTTSDLIASRVMLEAKRELFYTSKNLSDIAFGLGFSDYAYFSRLFKKHTGLTPSAFQKKYT